MADDLPDILSSPVNLDSTIAASSSVAPTPVKPVKMRGKTGSSQIMVNYSTSAALSQPMDQSHAVVTNPIYKNPTLSGQLLRHNSSPELEKKILSAQNSLYVRMAPNRRIEDDETFQLSPYGHASNTTAAETTDDKAYVDVDGQPLETDLAQSRRRKLQRKRYTVNGDTLDFTQRNIFQPDLGINGDEEEIYVNNITLPSDYHDHYDVSPRHAASGLSESRKGQNLSASKKGHRNSLIDRMKKRMTLRGAADDTEIGMQVVDSAPQRPKRLISNRDEENHGFQEQIKTSILDDKANKPKAIIKITMALLLIAIFVVSAFFLSIGFYTWYQSKQIVCLPNTVMDALDVDFTNSSCSVNATFCGESILTTVTVKKLCDPFYVPGYQTAILLQSNSPRLNSDSRGYVAGLSTRIAPLQFNQTENATINVCVGEGSSVLVVCLLRVGEKLKLGQMINFQKPLDRICAAVGVFPSATPCGGVKWKISPRALANFTSQIVSKPITCDQVPPYFATEQGRPCNATTETEVPASYDYLEVVFGGLFFAFIFLSNIDLAMRIQPILFKGFSSHPRPPPNFALDAMRNRDGHLGIVTPAISEEHVVVMKTIMSVILSMLVCEKINRHSNIDYFIVTGRKQSSANPYLEMFMQITHVLSKSYSDEANKIERKAFAHMVKFLAKHEGDLKKGIANWQALKMKILAVPKVEKKKGMNPVTQAKTNKGDRNWQTLKDWLLEGKMGTVEFVGSGEEAADLAESEEETEPKSLLEAYIEANLLQVDPRIPELMRRVVAVDSEGDEWKGFIPIAREDEEVKKQFAETFQTLDAWKIQFNVVRAFNFYCLTLKHRESVLKATSLNAARHVFLFTIFKTKSTRVNFDERKTESFMLVVDCRHAPDPDKFYVGMLLREFYQVDLEADAKAVRDHNVLMTQAPQFFNMPTDEPDLLGINGTFFFSVINILRGLTGKVTSSGAHSIWVMARRKNGEIKNTTPFPEEPFSLTEDLHGTLRLWPKTWWRASHIDCIRCEGRVQKSIGSSRYVPVIVSKAIPKSFKDFLRAYCRWGIGAVQLCPTYSLWSYIPFILLATAGLSCGMILPVMLKLLGSAIWVNFLFTIAPIFVGCLLFVALSYNSEVFQAKCVQWVATSNWLFSTLSGLFWPTVLPLFFAFGYQLPFSAFYFACFAVVKSFLELLGYEFTKSVVNKLTKTSGLKDDKEYTRNFLTFMTLWPLNIYAVGHVLTYPVEWTPNPIPTLTKIFVAQTLLQIAVIAISIYTIVQSTIAFNPAIISLILATAYFLFMGPYFFFFYYLNNKKMTAFGMFGEKTEHTGILFKFYKYYTDALFLIPFQWMIFLFSIAVFFYVLFGTCVISC